MKTKMKSEEKPQTKKIGVSGYLNKNCWLIRNLNYVPYRRCQYCELKFRNCLFLHYQIISLVLIIVILTLSFLIETKSSGLLIISVFTLVIVYGYFFNKSTDRLIQSNFNERKAKKLLEDFNKTLQQKVDEQTKAIRRQKEEVERAYEAEKKGRQLEEQARKELQHLDGAKSQFMLATQHHLRTPLTAMKGYLSLLLEGRYGRISQAVKKALLSFQTSTERLIKLVNEFLNISQFQLGKGILNLQKTSVKELILDVISELKSEAEDRGLELNLAELNVLQQLPAIMVDQAKLKEALFNIIDNAIKYTEKGKVTVTLKTEGSNLKIIVQDTGIGMSEEELKELFTNSFERGEQAKKVYALGRGIGLFIAYNIIKEHRGKLWASSPGKGQGSAFYVELPLSYNKR